MRRCVALCCLAAGTALAQAPAEQPSLSNDAAYQQIEAGRAQASSYWDAQEAQCYQRFAVNDCIKQVQTGRNAKLAELRRQETALRERERAERGKEQLERIAQRAKEKREAQTPEQIAASARNEQERLKVQQEKQSAHAARVAASGVPVESGRTASQEPGTQNQASSRADFQRKQAAAVKKREEIALRQAEKTVKKAAPLPLPP